MGTVDSKLGAPAIRHEHRDPSVLPILWTLVGLTLGVIFVGIGVYVMYWYLASPRSAPPLENPMADTAPQVPPAPRLEVQPAVELQTLRSDEDRLLSTYGWTDKEHGIVRLPIEKAMELQLQRGFPTKP